MSATLAVRRLETPASHGSAAVYAEPEPWLVRGYAPGANSDGSELHRDISTILWTIYADLSDDLPGELDHVVLAGDEYSVEGRPADWTNGPWPNPYAGVVVQLKRVEG